MSIAASSAVVGGLVCACQEESVSTVSSGLSMRYLPGCAPAGVERVSVEPLGDFALGEQSLVLVTLEGDARRLVGALPASTSWYRLGVTTESYRGLAVARAGVGGQRFDALVLPLQQPCAVSSERLPVASDVGVVLVAGQDLLLAGGVDITADARNQASVLRVSRPALVPDEQGLLVPRARVATVAVGAESWLLGGATSLRTGSAALDTFERYSAEVGGFIGLGRMRARRVAASALQLLDRRVLLVGGRSTVDGEPLRSVEVLTEDGEDAQLWSEELPFGAAGATLALRDDGRALVAARVEGALRLALLDPHTGGVQELSPPELLQDQAVAAELTVSLPGARVALFELDASDATTGVVQLLMPDGSYLVLSDWLSSFAGISRARTLALADGRILLSGVRQGSPVLRVIDPANRDVSARPLDLEVSGLFIREDGSVLLVGEAGARILREDARTAYDNPGGNLLAEDSRALCLDAYGRFERSGLTLRARVAGARFDLCGLRYRDVRIELSVSGQAELLVRREDGQERSIQVGTSALGPAFCELTVDAEQPITIVRRGQRISLQVANKEMSCVLDGFSGPVALALRALAEDVVVSELRVVRQ